MMDYLYGLYKKAMIDTGNPPAKFILSETEYNYLYVECMDKLLLNNSAIQNYSGRITSFLGIPVFVIRMDIT